MKTDNLYFLIIGLLLFGLSAIADADTYIVDRFDDSATATTCWQFAGNDCSLRGAIIKANQTTDPDTIYVRAGTYTLTIAGAGEDLAATGDLDIKPGLTIMGLGSGATIDGNDLDRVFHIAGSTGAVHLSNLTITGGNSSNGGGGIRNQSLLFLKDCAVTDNSSDFIGGGIYNSGGSLYLDRTSVNDNQATQAGGIYNQTGTNLNIEDSTIYGNTASNGAGGGVFNNGSSTIRRTSIWANHTYYDSGSHARGGGGIYNSGFLRLFNCSLAINWAHDDPGGAIYNSNSLDLTHVSISSNLSNPGTSGTAIANVAGGDLTMVNTLIVGKCNNDGGSITSTGGNLEQRGNTCLLTGPGDQVNVADAMTTFTDVGGSSKKCIVLEEGSPAIDLGYGTYCSDKDQRGFDRPVDGDGNGSVNCDIGAFEILADLPIFSDGFESGNTWRWDYPSP
jgi:hypothetical protein